MPRCRSAPCRKVSSAFTRGSCRATKTTTKMTTMVRGPRRLLSALVLALPMTHEQGKEASQATTHTSPRRDCWCLRRRSAAFWASAVLSSSRCARRRVHRSGYCRPSRCRGRSLCTAMSSSRLSARCRRPAPPSMRSRRACAPAQRGTVHAKPRRRRRRCRPPLRVCRTPVARQPRAASKPSPRCAVWAWPLTLRQKWATRAATS
mmetsp:Transcript_8788/g.35919  ORF Transcript_8788/g.35919 Transcript_8788/m.35919 type:complete len:205 (+) Transcript_8788:1871-2485(+)